MYGQKKKKDGRKGSEPYGIWLREPSVSRLEKSAAQIVHGKGGSIALTASARPCSTCFVTRWAWRSRSRACVHEKGLRQVFRRKISSTKSDNSLTDSALCFSRSSCSLCEVIVAK